MEALKEVVARLCSNEGPAWSVLTGPNGSGKSLVSQIWLSWVKRQGFKRRSWSYETRLGSTGLFRASHHSSDNPLGFESVRGCFLTLGLDWAHYLNTDGKVRWDSDTPSWPSTAVVLDEPEIGASPELSASIGQILAQAERTKPENLRVLILTHSREIVTALPAEIWAHTQGRSRASWLEGPGKRVLKPSEYQPDYSRFKVFLEWAKALYGPPPRG